MMKKVFSLVGRKRIADFNRKEMVRKEVRKENNGDQSLKLPVLCLALPLWYYLLCRGYLGCDKPQCTNFLARLVQHHYRAFRVEPTLGYHVA